MINKKEYREGNLVSLSLNGITFGVGRLRSKSTWVQSDLPITEETLMIFKDIDYNGMYILPSKKHYIRKGLDGQWILWSDFGTICDNLKHIAHIQNLYFFIVGEELMCKYLNNGEKDV